MRHYYFLSMVLLLTITLLTSSLAVLSHSPHIGTTPVLKLAYETNIMSQKIHERGTYGNKNKALP